MTAVKFKQNIPLDLQTNKGKDNFVSYFNNKKTSSYNERIYKNKSYNHGKNNGQKCVKLTHMTTLVSKAFRVSLKITNLHRKS